MKLEEGIIGIILPIFGIVVKVIYDLFQQKLDSTEIIKKRLLKYFIASGCIVFLYFIIVYVILNKDFLFEIPQSDNEILLIIFISSMLYFYFNAVISTSVMKDLLASDDSKLSKLIKKLINMIKPKMREQAINKKRSFVMIASQVTFLIFFFCLNSYFIPPKNFVVKDTVVKLGEETFVLPSKTTFELCSKSNENTDSDSKSNYTFKFNDSKYTLPKCSKIILFKNTDLKVVKLKDKEGYVDTLRWNNQTIVTLRKKVTVTLENDTTVMRSQKDHILLTGVFSHHVMLCVGLIIYYSKDFFPKS